MCETCSLAHAGLAGQGHVIIVEASWPKANTRTKDPANPSNDLGWLNCVLDSNCYCVLEVCYRLDKEDQNSPFFEYPNRKIIEEIEKDQALRAEFLQKKAHMNNTLLQCLDDGRREPTHPVGTSVRIIDFGATEDCFEELDFYTWADYQKNASLGNKSGKVVDGHCEVVYKGERGVAIFRKPKDCIRVKVFKQSGSSIDNVLSTTINESEIAAGEIKQATTI